MKFVSLLSGGKDSVYATWEAIKNGHELVCTAHLAPPPDTLETHSFMYQSAASVVLPALSEECLGVPLISICQKGSSLNQQLNYTLNNDHSDGNENHLLHDEVEDLYELLSLVKAKHPEVQAVSCGAILSNYQRTRVEHVCARLNLTVLSYLWRVLPQAPLLDQMIADGMEAILVKVAAPGLLPRRHLNKSIAALRYTFDVLYNKYRLNVAGEGGEYETLVLDCPLFKKKLVLDEVEVVYDDDDDGGGMDEVGVLRIVKYHCEEKQECSSHGGKNVHNMSTLVEEPKYCDDGKLVFSNNIYNSSTVTSGTSTEYIPKAKMFRHGLMHFSQIVAPSTRHTKNINSDTVIDDSEAAVVEALYIFNLAKKGLEAAGCTRLDVLFVHLYLTKISHFGLINLHYQEFFGSVLPPSRSCVALGSGNIPHGRSVMMDMCVQRGSGDFVRGKEDICDQMNVNKLREVLHVQGRSYWAPVCVGPYSQANVLRGGVIMLAGQIGLNPPTMTLVDGGWQAQLAQSWKNAAAVLDALSEGRGGKLSHCFGALVYVSSDIFGYNKDDQPREENWRLVRQISLSCILKNAQVIPGYIDDRVEASEEENDGYEDAETAAAMRQLSSDDKSIDTKLLDDIKEVESIPLLVVAIPEMPVGALCEVELVSATNKAANACGIMSRRLERRPIAPTTNEDLENNLYQDGEMRWNCGYNKNPQKISCKKSDYSNNLFVEGSVRYIPACCGVSWINVASQTAENISVDLENALDIMTDQIIKSSKDSNMHPKNILHVRLYCLAENDDGSELISSLRTTLQTKLGGFCACTVVPVEALEGGVIFSAQVMMMDPVHLETEMWVRHGREKL